MKKKLILGIVLFMTTVLVIGCSKNTEKDSTKKETGKEKYVIGIDDSFPPMGFRDENKNVVGFDIDLAKAVGKDMGVEFEFKPIDWSGKTLSLKSKEIDLIWNGFTITEERKKEVAFTKAYLANKQILIVNTNSKLTSKDDFKDKILGLQLGSSSSDALDKHEDFKKSLKEVKEYSNNTEALLDLKTERVDGVLVDEVVGRYYMSKEKGKFKILDGDLGKEEYGVGVRKEDKELLKKLNESLVNVSKSDEGKKISEKWFGENILILK